MIPWSLDLQVLLVLAAVVGLCVGSFLNVVIWRLPRRESLLRPASACPHCHGPIRSRDNVPIAGWLLLRGRCRDCQGHISARYPVVEGLCAALFAALALRFGVDVALPAYLYLAAAGLALGFIDVDTRRLPDVLTLPSYLVMGVLLGVAAVLHSPSGSYSRALLGGLATYALYMGLRVAYPAGMGGGDVKLSGVLGLALAWLGWGVWTVGVFAGFVLGGLWGVGLIVLRQGGRKTAIPYGPFMLAGALIAVFVGEPLAAAYVALALQ